MSEHTMHPKLRAAALNDLAAVEGLLTQASLPTDGVRDFFPDNYAVLESDRSVIGAVGVEQYGDYGLLRSAVVAQSERGNGLGAKLVEERLEWSRVRGISDIFLLTTTAPRFFEKLGFQQVDRTAVPIELQAAPEFKSLCPSTATVMRLSL